MTRLSRLVAFEYGFWRHVKDDDWYRTSLMIDYFNEHGMSWSRWHPTTTGSDTAAFQMFEFLTENKPSFRAWHRVGFELAGAMTYLHDHHHPDLPNGRHDLRVEFEDTGIPLNDRRRIVEKVWQLKRSKRTYIQKGRIRVYDLKTPLALEIKEEVREFAKGQDEEESRIMETKRQSGNGQPYQINVGNLSGTLNLGSVGTIASSVTTHNSGSSPQDIAAIVSSLSERIRNEPSLDPYQKIEALESMRTLCEQAALPEGQRKGHILKSTLDYLPKILQSTASAAKLWQEFGPSMVHFFRNLA